MAKRRRRRGGRRANLSLVSTELLRAELRRRADALVVEERSLQSRLAELREQIDDIRGESGPGAGRGGRGGRRGGKRAAIPGRARAGRRRRPRNEMSLREALQKALRGKTLGVLEAADAVKQSGYKTSSPNFRTIVNQALLDKKLFKNVARGKYTAA